MGESKMTAAKLKPIILAFLVMLMAAGCSSANLGDIDETLSERDDMAGPGIFADEDGESTLKWSTKVKPSDAKPAQAATEVEADMATTGIESEQSSATATQEVPVPAMEDKAEFEEFKKWNRLRSEGANSAEYQEFLLWLKYQQFKN